MIDAIRERMISQFGSLFDISAGVFSYTETMASFRRALPGLEVKIDKNAAIDLASYALVSFADEKELITVHFDNFVPGRIIRQLRTAKAIQRAEKDFENFSKYGVMTPGAVNSMALIYYEAGDFAKADGTYFQHENYVREAKDRVTFLNVCLVKQAVGDIPAAASWLTAALEVAGMVSSRV